MPPDADVDPLMWWEDKQVAVEMSGRVIRAWVLRSRSHPGPPRADGRAGYMKIVLLASSARDSEQHPGEVTIPVYAAVPHGRPLGVLGIWPEGDLSDAHPTSPTRAASAYAGGGPTARSYSSRG